MSSAALPGKEATIEMGLIRRYRTALMRHHRSRGFGIHSPSAYRFVTEVLRERCPYYAYDDLRTLRKALQADGERCPGNREVQLLFRLVNHFAPQHILLVGADSALTVVAMLMPSSQNDVYACGENDRLTDIVSQLDDRADRMLPYVEMKIGLFDYMATFLDQPKQPFVLINALPDPERATIMQGVLDEWLQGECVIILRNLHRDTALRQLWNKAKSMMTYGHTFTNGKIAILVARPNIPREDFTLWL